MTRKGLAAVFSYMFVIMVSMAVLAMVVLSANQIMTDNQEVYKYNEMTKNISLLYNDIVDVSHTRFSNKVTVITNVDELSIDCDSETITGKIAYTKAFKTDTNKIIDGITISKQMNKLVFEKTVNDNNIIDLNCSSFIFNKGKNIINIYYLGYDEDNQLIIMDINRLITDKNIE